MASLTNLNELSDVITQAPVLSPTSPLHVERSPTDVEEEASERNQRKDECWACCDCSGGQHSETSCFDTCLTFYCYDAWANSCGNCVDMCCLRCCCDGDCCGNCGDCGDCGNCGDCGDCLSGCQCDFNCCDI